jgi:hypothetical protein
LHELTASILTGIAEPALLGSEKNLRETFHTVAAHYPFMALLYTLDAEGVQSSSNIASLQPGKDDTAGLGKNRSERPYYLLAKNSDSVAVTEPYFSNNGSMLCMTAAVKRYPAGSNEAGYIVLDIDLTKAIEFLMGDLARRRFMPAFKGVYSLIVAGLFAVAGVLLYAAGTELISLWHIGDNKEDLHMKPFGVIIFLALRWPSSFSAAILGSADAQRHLPPQLHPPHHHALYRRNIDRSLDRGLVADVQGSARREWRYSFRSVDDAYRRGFTGGTGHIRLSWGESGSDSSWCA